MRGTARIGIVGLGAIGTSIGLALKNRGHTVLGLDVCPLNSQAAQTMGAVHRTVDRPGELDRCRAVFVAVPPGRVVEVAAELLDSTGATVIDVSSVKAEIAQALPHPRFVPSHPMAGTHLSGPGGACDELFAGATWAICPTRWTSRTRLLTTEGLIRSMGAKPLRIDAVEHDAVLASTSHLPHLVASGLVHVLGDRDGSAVAPLVGQGFLDTTRIARANPELWADITLHNRQEVGRSISQMVERLQGIGEAIAEGNRAHVLEFFADACRMIEHSLPAGPRATTTRIISFRSHRPAPAGKELGGTH